MPGYKHDNNKPFHTFHGEPPPIAISPSWCLDEDDENVYRTPPLSPDPDHLGHCGHLDHIDPVDALETTQWLINLDGAQDCDPSSPTCCDSRSPSIASPTTPRTRSPEPTPAFRATVPKASPARAARPALPASFFSDPSLRPRTPQNDKRFPDRFIPDRDSPATTPRSEMYRMTKPPSELTTSEMFLRHRGDTPDPFSAHPKPPRRGADSTHDNESRPTSPTASTGAGHPTVLSPIPTNTNTNSQPGGERQVSYGSTWSVGGIAPTGNTVNNGRGGLVQSGTNVPVYTTTYPSWRSTGHSESQKHRERLASALDIDRANRILDVPGKTISSPGYTRNPMRRASLGKKTRWTGHKWEKESTTPTKNRKVSETRVLPSSPFKVLDAPGLRDDFYCSILAFSPNCNTLAVGLGNTVYGWSEENGVTCLNAGVPGEEESTWITSLAFSSAEGGKSILAVGRSSGKVALLSLFDGMIPRFELVYAHAVTALAWRPRTSARSTKSPFENDSSVFDRSGHGVRRVKAEDLLVGDERGRLWYYTVEWPEGWEVQRNGWSGRPTLLARIQAHSQQICGLSWSPEGRLFASGGNDDFCSLFEVNSVLGKEDEMVVYEDREEGRRGSLKGGDGGSTRLLRKLFGNDGKGMGTHEWLNRGGAVRKRGGLGSLPRLDTAAAGGSRDKGKKRLNTMGSHKDLPASTAKHRWRHGAAVKAIAFCPWRSGLLATRGGSHDKAIHFFHTTTGAALATIAVSAQVTSLIWSKTKREIAACFGYAQPEHPVRIAVFSWPQCKQVATIPWEGEMRALCAVGWPVGVPPGVKMEKGKGKARDGEVEVGKENARGGRGRQGTIVTNSTGRHGDGGEGSSRGSHSGEGGGMRTAATRSMDKRRRRRGRRGTAGKREEELKKQKDMWEGCIVVAASDESVKFHEVWEADNRIAAGGPGMLGGSDILEGLEGIDKEGDVIR